MHASSAPLASCPSSTTAKALTSPVCPSNVRRCRPMVQRGLRLKSQDLTTYSAHSHAMDVVNATPPFPRLPMLHHHTHATDAQAGNCNPSHWMSLNLISLQRTHQPGVSWRDGMVWHGRLAWCATDPGHGVVSTHTHGMVWCGVVPTHASYVVV